MALFPCSSPFPPLSCHKPVVISKTAIPVTLISKTLTRETSKILLSASKSFHYPAFRSSSCSKSSDDTPKDENLSSNRIFIKGLPRSTSEGFLAKTFSQFGEVTRVKIITDRSSKQSLGMAYAWFTCEEHAKFSVKEMDGKFVDGRYIVVKIASPESPTPKARTLPIQFK